MARSLAFHRRLGLDLPATADTEPHVEVTLAGGLRLAWDTEEVLRSFDPGFEPARGGNRVALAFDCTAPAGVDQVFADLTAAGAPTHLAPFDAVWGQRYAVVLDGGSVDLFATLG